MQACLADASAKGSDKVGAGVPVKEQQQDERGAQREVHHANGRHVMNNLMPYSCVVQGVPVCWRASGATVLVVIQLAALKSLKVETRKGFHCGTTSKECYINVFLQ